MSQSQVLVGVICSLFLHILVASWATVRTTAYSYPPPPPTSNSKNVKAPPPQHPIANTTPPSTNSSVPASGGTHRTATTVTFNVVDSGALGDGQTNDTLAFVEAWAAACAVANGVVYVPAGFQFLVYPISFSGPCKSNLALQLDGTILAPSDPSVWDSYGNKWLVFKKVSMTMTGWGTINGQGQQWWAKSCKTNASNPCVSAPTALDFETCTNVTVKNVNILNSQQIHLAFEKSSGVLVSNVTVTAPGTSPNTDGIHIQNTSFVTIVDSAVGTGDDCISIQTGSFGVNIKNVTCGPGHGISVGGLGKSKSRAEVADMVVDSVVFTNTTNGVRIKSWQGSSGYATNFSFKNLQMINSKYPIVIDEYYCDSASSGSCANYTSNVVLSNITYRNIKGTSGSTIAVKIYCSDSVPCTGISLSNIDLVQTSGKVATSSCYNALGSASGTMVPPSCLETSLSEIGHLHTN